MRAAFILFYFIFEFPLLVEELCPSGAHPFAFSYEMRAATGLCEGTFRTREVVGNHFEALILIVINRYWCLQCSPKPANPSHGDSKQFNFIYTVA
jgi:hypothetical protein